MRAVPEWVGATPDAKIPDRVKERVWLRCRGRCGACDRKIQPGDKWETDHEIALINGGEHRESNLRIICDWCHKPKTAQDVAEKAAVSRKRRRHIGLTKPSKFPGSKSSRIKRKIGGEIVDRATGEPIRPARRT